MMMAEIEDCWHFNRKSVNSINKRIHINEPLRQHFSEHFSLIETTSPHLMWYYLSISSMVSTYTTVDLQEESCEFRKW